MLQSLWRGLFAPSAISYAIVFGEADPPSARPAVAPYLFAGSRKHGIVKQIARCDHTCREFC
jgi:hypothetical protein